VHGSRFGRNSLTGLTLALVASGLIAGCGGDSSSSPPADRGAASVELPGETTTAEKKTEKGGSEDKADKSSKKAGKHGKKKGAAGKKAAAKKNKKGKHSSGGTSGGKRGSKKGSAKSPARKDPYALFVAHTDGVCTDFRAKKRSLGAEPSGGDERAAYYDKLGDLISNAIASIRSVDAPAKNRSVLDRYVSLLESNAADLHRLADAARRKNGKEQLDLADRIRKNSGLANQAARSYGLHVCGS
jgi:hypothetical protein